MYLALILGFCVSMIPSVQPVAALVSFLQINQQSQSDAPQSGPPQVPSQDAPTAPPTGENSPDSQKSVPEKAESKKSEPDKTAPERNSPSTGTRDDAPAPQKEPVDSTATPKPGPAANASTKKKHRRKRVAGKSTSSTPDKKVVRNGGTVDPQVQLAPGVSDEQASLQRQSTTQLLSSTDTNLKQISARQLDPSQQKSLEQIRKYMEQAKAAEATGDVQRAQNLASKALLLSDDLVKH